MRWRWCPPSGGKCQSSHDEVLVSAGVRLVDQPGQLVVQLVVVGTLEQSGYRSKADAALTEGVQSDPMKTCRR